MSAPNQTALPPSPLTAITVTKEDFKRESQWTSNFKIVRKADDPRFGSIVLIKTPSSDRLIAVREKRFSDQKELSEEILEIKKRLQVRDDRLLTLLDFSTGEKSDFCSTTYWIKIFFEYPDHDIDQELRRRNTQAGYAGFTSSELTHLLYNTLHAGKVLNDNNRYHGDISPECVEMDTPQNYKLVEVFGELSKPELHQSQRLISGGHRYSAPEVYQKMLNGTFVKGNEKGPKSPQLISTLKQADVFSLGMTILHAGTDEGVDSVYKNDGTIDKGQLNNLKQKFQTKFARNTLLTSTVLAMLEENVEERPKDLASVLAVLPPYNSVRQAFEQERVRELQAASQQSNLYNNPANLQAYLNQTQWEQHWMPGQPELPRQQAPPANSPLMAHLPRLPATTAPAQTQAANQTSSQPVIQSQPTTTLVSGQTPVHYSINQPQHAAVSYSPTYQTIYQQPTSGGYYHPLSTSPGVQIVGRPY